MRGKQNRESATYRYVSADLYIYILYFMHMCNRQACLSVYIYIMYM